MHSDGGMMSCAVRVLWRLVRLEGTAWLVIASAVRQSDWAALSASRSDAISMAGDQPHQPARQTHDDATDGFSEVALCRQTHDNEMRSFHAHSLGRSPCPFTRLYQRTVIHAITATQLSSARILRAVSAPSANQ